MVFMVRIVTSWGWGGQGGYPSGLSFGGGGRRDLRNANRKERSQGRSLLDGHGTFSTSKVGSWRLAAVGGWRLVGLGGWRLVGVGSGWRLAFGGPWVLSLTAVLSKKKKGSGCLRRALRPVTRATGGRILYPWARVRAPIRRGHNQDAAEGEHLRSSCSSISHLICWTSS